jgi:hypothetical protein
MNDSIHSNTNIHIIEVLHLSNRGKGVTEQGSDEEQQPWAGGQITTKSLDVWSYHHHKFTPGIHALVVIITLPKGQFSSLKEITLWSLNIEINSLWNYYGTKVTKKIHYYYYYYYFKLYNMDNSNYLLIWQYYIRCFSFGEFSHREWPLKK